MESNGSKKRANSPISLVLAFSTSLAHILTFSHSFSFSFSHYRSLREPIKKMCALNSKTIVHAMAWTEWIKKTHTNVIFIMNEFQIHKSILVCDLYLFVVHRGFCCQIDINFCAFVSFCLVHFLFSVVALLSSPIIAK